MLFSLAAILISCGGDDDASDVNVDLSKKSVAVDISEFNLVYADSQNKTRAYKAAITEFASMVTETTGVRVIAKLNTSTTPSGKEILVGNTGRSASTDALNSIKGDGFAITADENTIAIVGTSDILTLQAVMYFRDHYLTGDGSSSVISVHKSAKADNVAMITLADSESSNYTYIYSQDLYDKKLHYEPLLTDVYATYDMRDMPVSSLERITEKLSKATGLRSKNFTIKSDKIESSGAEFLIGNTNRPLSAECLARINPAEYGFFVKDGQFVVSAWSDASLAALEKHLLELITEATVTVDGKPAVVFPEGFYFKGYTDNKWVLDFPKPEGVNLYGTLDTADNSLLFLYKGEGANATTFQNYISTLKSEGYRMLTENEIEDSLYATMVNDAEEIMLYVSYNAFAHEAEYEHEYDPVLRIVSSPVKTATNTDGVAVPDASILTKQPYTKITNTSVTALELVGQSVGMGYIITLEDGSFVLFDGGSAHGGYEAPNIWDILNEHYRRTHNGAAPTASDPIRIAAWVITHSHGDHYSVFNKFLSTYGSRSDFKMDYLVGNYPSDSAVYNVLNSDIACMNSGIITNLQKKVGFTYLKVHSGQKYYFANLEMEVLMTYDDLAPMRIKNQNDTSTVLRFSMQATTDGNTEVGDPYVMIWTGDANNRQSRYMCAMFGDYLEADMVQVAHHGNIGCESDFYDAVKAEVVWFPHSLQGYRGWLNPGSKNNSWVRKVDWKLINESAYTKYVFVSGAPDNNGNPLGYHLTLPFGDDGRPDFDKIYNTLNGTQDIIEYTSDTVNGHVAIKPPQNWN